MVAHYKCHNITSVAAQSDSDYHIMKHPTTFRFSVGRSVVFNPSLAIGAGKSEKELNASDCWVQGTVLQTDVTGRHDCYCVYECSFGSKGKSKCYITQDDDEHIAMVKFDPRERLLEAISQDCTPHHLSYLAESYSIDVSTFRDMVVNKAIEYGSYNVRYASFHAYLNGVISLIVFILVLLFRHLFGFKKVTTLTFIRT